MRTRLQGSAGVAVVAVSLAGAACFAPGAAAPQIRSGCNVTGDPRPDLIVVSTRDFAGVFVADGRWTRRPAIGFPQHEFTPPIAAWPAQAVALRAVPGTERSDIVFSSTDGCKGSEFVWIYRWSDRDQPPSVVQTITQSSPSTECDVLGHSLVAPGDVTGDGIDDLAVGGKTHIVIFRGHAGPGLFDTANPVVVPSPGVHPMFADALTRAGDVTGDRVGDILAVHGWRKDFPEGPIGHLISRAADGTHSLTAVPFPRDVDDLDHVGRSVAGELDMDGDNCADFAIPAMYARLRPDSYLPKPGRPTPSTGAVLLYSGDDASWWDRPGVLWPPDNKNEHAEFQFGAYVANIGDFNNDGTPDLGVSEFRRGSGYSPPQHRVHVYSGSNLHAAAALPIPVRPLRTILLPAGDPTEQGPEAANFARIAGLGDVDADGFDDVLLGLPAVAGAVNGTTDVPGVGVAYLVHGGREPRSGDTAPDTWLLVPNSAPCKPDSLGLGFVVVQPPPR